MVQHVLLLAVAGPLLAFGLPIPTLVWSLPDRHRRRVLALHAPDRCARTTAGSRSGSPSRSRPKPSSCGRGTSRSRTTPRSAIPALHALEHATFLLVSVTAWWSVTSVRRSLRGAAAIAALFGSLPGMALGVAMVLAPHPWYPVYAGSGRARRPAARGRDHVGLRRHGRGHRGRGAVRVVARASR